MREVRETIENKQGWAESRATTILMSLFGYTTVLELAGQDAWDKMLEMMASELMVIAEQGFTEMYAAPDCHGMDAEEIARVLPGMITWVQLKEAANG